MMVRLWFYDDDDRYPVLVHDAVDVAISDSGMRVYVRGPLTEAVRRRVLFAGSDDGGNYVVFAGFKAAKVWSE